MHAIRFIFGSESDKIVLNDEVHCLTRDCIVVTHSGEAPPKESHVIDVYPADFRLLLNDIRGLVEEPSPKAFWPEKIRLIEIPPAMTEILMQLKNTAPAVLLRFIYVYCLITDNKYFSQLLHRMVSGEAKLLDFINQNALLPWSVSRFSQELDIPTRKLNALFIEKFGITAKHWLIERRLSHAVFLLTSTPLKIIDIALECGFTNHSHFSVSFKKHYNCNPKKYRRRI